MKIWILVLVSLLAFISTLISLFYSTKPTEFDKSLMRDVSSYKSQEIDVFVISSEKFNSLYGNLISSSGDKSIKNECSICSKPLIASGRKLAVIVHKKAENRPHCFHYTCLDDWLRKKRSECPSCKKIIEINDEYRARCSLEEVFRADLKNLREEDRRNIVSHISKTYRENTVGTVMLFFDERFSDDTLRNIILNERSHESLDLQQSLRDVIQIKRGIQKTGIDECIRCCIRLLRASKYSYKMVDFLGTLIVENGISSEIKSLDLSHGCITADNLKSFAGLFSKLENLESLEILGNKLRGREIKIIMESLRGCKKLTVLDVSHNEIGVDGARAIEVLLKTRVNLKSLSISYNGIGDEEAKSIGNGLKGNENLTFLNVSNNNIGDDGAKAIGNGLKGNRNLTFLNVSNNNIGDEGIVWLADPIKECTGLISLNVSKNQIHGHGMIVMLSALEDNNSLVSFNVSGNSIKADGTIETMKGWKGLVLFDISDSNIGDEESKGIGNVLKGCPNLTTLNLSNNNIGAEGAKAIGNGLKHCPNLTTLNISNNNVGVGGAKAIAESFKTKENMTSLDIASNKIGDNYP